MDALTTSLLISLRQLAACLKASSRAYVDPTNVLKIINELNTSLNKAAPCIGIQQVLFLRIFVQNRVYSCFNCHCTMLKP